LSGLQEVSRDQSIIDVPGKEITLEKNGVI